MLFNSTAFLFVFLPFVLFVFHRATRAHRRAAAVAFLVLASYMFYGWAEPRLVVLLLLSSIANFMLGRAISRNRMAARAKTVNVVLAAAVTGNLALLGYFKYANFFVSAFAAFSGAQQHWTAIVLPVGISFYTFTQIAFLVDTARNRDTQPSLGEYLLFVSYFPHLVAGPILHHRDTIPQFRSAFKAGIDSAAMAAGLSIFSIGLAKKTLIADQLAPMAERLFSLPTHGSAGSFEAWSGAVAYSFQIYFDFSGYSDMAIGLSLMLGVRMPLNFHSPYKATSIIEFWQRWHISLSRFLRDYLYIPLGGNRRGRSRRYLNLMVTMLLGGLWHGAGWTFLIWGGIHGALLAVNHAMRAAGPAPSGDKASTVRTRTGRVCVFGLVTLAWVFFRADSASDALTILGWMFGWNGIGQLRWEAAHLLLVMCFVIVWMAPNTAELFRDERPVIVPPGTPAFAAGWRWRPSVPWALILGATMTAGIFAMTEFSPFLYFRF